jgi:hypothetical protein
MKEYASRRIMRFGRTHFIKRKVDKNFATLSRLASINHKFEGKLSLFIKK